MTRRRPPRPRPRTRPAARPAPSGPGRDDAGRTRLVAKGPEDLLALVPVLLGFEPEESVVLLTFPNRDAPGARCFHARVDLPHDEEERVAVAQVLRAAVERHRVQRLALVVVSTDAEAARAAGRHLAGTFADREVVALLHADGGRWWALGPDGRPRDEAGSDYEVSHHRFRAQAVVEGRVVAPSRAAVADAVAPDGTASARVGWHARAQIGPLPPEGLRRAGQVVEVPDVEEARAWVVALLLRAAHGGAPGAATDAEVARLALVLHDPLVREAGWWLLTDPDGTGSADLDEVGASEVGVAERRLDAWVDLLRRTPPSLCPPVAILTSAAAVLAGQGVIAVAALERCIEVDAGFPMADVLSTVVQRAVRPEEFRASLVPCFGQALTGRGQDVG